MAQEATGQDGPCRAVLLNDTRVENHHGCDTVIASIFKLAAEAGLEISATAPANSDWRKDSRVTAAIDRADVIIVNGEGTLHHDAPWGEALLAAGAYAAAKGMPAVLINATWQDNGARYAALVRDFALVSVRESASAQALRSVGVPCRIVPDLALLEDICPGARDRSAGFSDNVVRASTLALHRRMKATGGTWISLFQNKITLREIYRGLRQFLPGLHLFNPLAAFEVLGLLMHDARAREPDGARWKSEVARRSLVVTGRFHLMIFCLASRTPFLAVASNTHKIASTLDDAGLGWRQMTEEALTPQALSGAAVWQAGELDRLEAYLERARTDMRSLFIDIRNLARQRPRAGA